MKQETKTTIISVNAIIVFNFFPKCLPLPRLKKPLLSSLLVGVCAVANFKVGIKRNFLLIFTTFPLCTLFLARPFFFVQVNTCAPLGVKGYF